MVAKFSNMVRAHRACYRSVFAHVFCTEAEKMAILTSFTYGEKSRRKRLFSFLKKETNSKNILPFVYFLYPCVSFSLTNYLKSLPYYCKRFAVRVYNKLIFSAHLRLLHFSYKNLAKHAIPKSLFKSSATKSRF